MGSIRSSASRGPHPQASGDILTPPQEKDLQENPMLPLHERKTHPHRYVLGLFRVDSAGESGRKGFHPAHFLRVCSRSVCTASMIVNILWPFVPAAIVMHFARPDLHVWVFALNYIAMVPSANLLGFAGGELSKKLPKVLGVLLETALSAVVEIVLFMVLLHNSSEEQDFIPVIQAAILGSILANLLLCLGDLRNEQVFHEAVSEVGTGLLLVAGFGLLIPSAFYTALKGSVNTEFTLHQLEQDALTISRATAVILLVAFFVYLVFNLHSHNSIFDEIFESDEAQDEDRDQELLRAKLTFFECIVAIVISLTCVCMSAVFLVQEIEYIVALGVSDNFMGLILVPLVEKAAEHLTAVDEAWDNQMNFALFHCLGPSIQTALLNAPLAVIAGWGLDKKMSLNFEIFMVVLLVLSILVVGNFLRDGKSNYLEGALCVLVYVIIAITSWYYPGVEQASTNQA
ncbi:hypothetical protein N7526_011173 [Penicillium atrosanguineum]|nr:hypothetical protein N7526_011173 [Penicillium atrosanguineum]